MFGQGSSQNKSPELQAFYKKVTERRQSEEVTAKGGAGASARRHSTNIKERHGAYHNSRKFFKDVTYVSSCRE